MPMGYDNSTNILLDVGAGIDFLKSIGTGKNQLTIIFFRINY